MANILIELGPGFLSPVYILLLLLSPPIVGASLDPSQTYPLGVCNDGTHAGYYHDTDTSKQGHKVHVNLQGGNLCDSAQDCHTR